MVGAKRTKVESRQGNSLPYGLKRLFTTLKNINSSKERESRNNSKPAQLVRYEQCASSVDMPGLRLISWSRQCKI